MNSVCRASIPLFLLLIVLSFANISAAEAWTVERDWTEAEEIRYSEWFATLASKQWSSTTNMLRSREYNSLFDERDLKMTFYADCGDFPYVIRAYYAWKRGLPFVGNYVQFRRYSKTPNTTQSTFDSVSHKGSVQSFFAKIQGVHSGNFRTGPDDDRSYTYPIEITHRTLRPGAVFYSPNGHVAMVAETRKDGTIKLVDAHPDQSVTRVSFGPKLEWRSRTYSGGFRWIRPARVEGNRAVFVTDSTKLFGYSREQYDFENYYATVADRIRRETINPVRALETYIREDTFRETLDRRDSVQRGWDVAQRRAIALPPNIYDAVGDWEDYSTPSRDLRLRHSYLYIPKLIQSYLQMMRTEPDKLVTEHTNAEALGHALLETKERLFRELTFEYTNSRGRPTTLSLNDVEGRLFDLSFDPNHAPELRWGAAETELKTADRSQKRFYRDYDQQQYWRNRLEKKQGRMRPGDRDNPRQKPRHDLSQMIVEAVALETGRQPSRIVLAVTNADDDG